MDDILANIRKSVETELDSLGLARPAPERGGRMRHALKEMRENMTVAVPQQQSRTSDTLMDLRGRIQRKVAAMEAERAGSARSESVLPQRRDFSGILSGTPKPQSQSQPQLRPSFASEDVPPPVAYAPPPVEPQWQVEEAYARQSYHGYHHEAYGEPQHQPLLSADTEALTESSFEALSNAILARAAGDRSLEEMTRDILHGLLKQWLDANLPEIVETIVREEIQRVARRGR